MTLAIHKQGFSLVETLLVLAIMSILAVLTMTSVSSLRSAALTSSGNQLVDVFAMARQNSISKNTYTVIVIKSQGNGAYGAYCLLELIQPDDGTPGSWTTIAPWHSLAHGVVFESGQSNDTFMSSSVHLPQPLPSSFPFQGQQVDLSTSSVYQCYQPDGTLLGRQNPPVRLRLIEGAANSSGNGSVYQGATVSGQETSYYDLVFVGNTGVTKIERP